MAKTKGTYGMGCVYKRGNVLEGKFPSLRVEGIRFEELAQDLINDYKVKGKKSLDRAERSVKRLKTFFGGMKAVDITADKVKSYILKRQGEDVKNGTINRELSALKRMFNLANQMTPAKVNHVPHIPHLEENPPRTGYFEHEEYIAIRDALPDHLKPVVITAYYTGCWREEILSLKWSQIDLIKKKITFEAGTTKNDEARVIFMPEELYEAIAFQRSLRDTKYPQCPWVFFNNEGERIRSFNRSWKTACKKTKLIGRIFHDFRRTAVRNMVRAGIPERVAMMISGHKTSSMFDRYNIVNDEDLRRAARRGLIEIKEEKEYLGEAYQIEKTGFKGDMVMLTLSVNLEIVDELVLVLLGLLDFSRVLKGQTRALEAEREAKGRALDPILKAQGEALEKEIYGRFLLVYPTLPFRKALRKVKESTGIDYWNLGIYETIIKQHWMADGKIAADLDRKGKKKKKKKKGCTLKEKIKKLEEHLKRGIVSMGENKGCPLEESTILTYEYRIRNYKKRIQEEKLKEK